ncbi:MAG: maf-like protein [Parachlamydiales bacterium]|nr:maf-like protein [Parachlamydiales bacterium]
MKKLILGSQSPRRRDILSFFSVPFEQVFSEFDETQVPFQNDPAAFACEVAERKAISLAERFPDSTILTADTIVYRDGRLFLKPESMQEALVMLSELAGKEHTVYTGVCALRGRLRFSEAESTRVIFHELTDIQIRAYHKQFNPLDKAGAYAIQGGGSIIVKRIEGCYYNIMGLPLNTTRRLLAKVGIDLWEYLKSV